MGARRRVRQTAKGPVGVATLARHNRQDGYTWQEETRARATREQETWRERDEEEA